MSRGGDDCAAGGEILIKLQVLKNGRLQPIMVNYGITEGRISIKLCSTPIN